VVLLQKALAAMPGAQRTSFWQDAVRTDKAFTRIRTSTGYRRLTQEYGEKGNEAKE
jgi:hypothetical protein